MKIRTQLIAGIIIFGLLLALISALVIVTNQQVDTLTKQGETANGIALEVGELGYLSNDYILYREPQQIDRWTTKFGSISGAIDSLSVDRPDQRAIVDNLMVNLNNSKSVFFDIASSQVQTDGGYPGFVQLSWSRMAVQNQGMIFDASRLANLIHAQLDGVKQTRSILIFALMGAFALLLLTSYFIGSRRLLQSLTSLQQGAVRVGTGDFSFIIGEISDDEIGDLARSFNRMTADLRNVTARKVDLEAEVHVRIQAETKLAQINEELGSANEELSAIQIELQQNLDELSRAQGDLRSSEERYRGLFEKMTEGFGVHEIICDAEGSPVDYRFLEINPAFELMTGLIRDDVIGKLVSEVLPGIERSWIERYGRVAMSGNPVHFESYTETLDRYYDLISYCPAPNQFAVLVSDITERKKSELNQRMMEDVLRILNRGGDLHGLIGEILSVIRGSIGFDAVGLRLHEGEDYPYYEHDGFSCDFLNKENSLCSVGTDGSYIRTSEGSTILECTCGAVITGQIDHSLPCFTDGGSFWTNRSSDLLDLAPLDDPRINPRNRCIHEGYQSVALIPVRTGSEIIGLLQLNDTREGRFTPDMISFYEVLADNIGLSLKRKQAENALAESEEKLQAIFSILPIGVSVVDLDRKVTYANLALERILGISKESLMKGEYAGRRYLRPDGTPMPVSEFPSYRAIAEQVPITDVDIHIVDEVGVERWENISAAPLPGLGAVIVTADISARKYNEDILRLSAEVNQVSSTYADLSRVLREYILILRQYTGCDAIGIRLLDEEGNIPYQAYIGFSDEFYNHESPLSIMTDQCMCINVVKGTTDPSKSFYTEGGSFYINATTKFLATASDEEKGRSRNVCNQVGYESVGLIPIRKGDLILGLIHLADHREGMVPEGTVEILEKIAHPMGSSILRIKAENELKLKNIELEVLNEELTRREKDLQKALVEKEVLLSEIHHRVKNNLTAFISLLSIEGATEDSPSGKMLKQDLQNRARSMALIHETLYRTNMYDEVDMGMYLTTLISQISNSFRTERPVQTIVTVQDVALDIPRATPAGLIINEIITNSFKYAFPEKFVSQKGREYLPVITVTLTKHDGKFEMIVKDNGIGLPPGFDISKTQTLGLKLVSFLANHQIRAEIEFNSHEGTEFILRFDE